MAGMSDYFSDPLLQQYLNASQSAMGRLNRPTSVQHIGTTNPTLQSAIGALQQLLHAPDAGFDYFRPIAERRMAELDQPGYTTSQLDQIRTQATNPLTAQRDAARQSVIQRFAAQGQGPDSGTVQEALLNLDRTYGQQTTQQDTQLAMNAAAQDEARRQERVNVGLQAAGLAGRNQGTQLSAASGLANIGSQQQGIDAQNAQLDLQRQQLDTSRLLQSMGLSQNLAQLPIQVQAQQVAALQALQGPIPSYSDPTLSALMSLAGLGENVNQTAQSNQANYWSQIAGMIPMLMAAYNQSHQSGK